MRVIVVVSCLIAFAQCDEVSDYMILLLYPVGTMVQGWGPIAMKGCPEEAKKFPDAMNEVENCLKASNASLDNYCDAFQKNVERCFKPAVKVATDCLPEKSKYLPQMYLKGYVSVNNFLCGIKDNSEILSGFECPMDEEKHTCLKTPDESLEKLASYLPTKSEVCQYADKITSCLQEALHDCKQKTIVNLYNAAFSECGSNLIIKQL